MNKLFNATQSLASRLDGRLRLHYVESCPSTSELLRELAGSEMLEQPLLVCTDEQYGGRGTRGRSWQMQRGKDLAFSIGLPLADGLEPSPRLPLALSVIIARSLANLIREQWRAARLYRQEDNLQPDSAASHGERVSQAINDARESLASRLCAVKWPNDLLLARPGSDGELQYSKCGGILIERIPHCLLIGIGLNVNSSAADYGPELAGSLTTIRDCCGMELDRETLFSGLALRLYGRLIFSGILQGFSAADDSAIRELEADWRELDRTAGQQWQLTRTEKQIYVTASHVDFSTGHLHVRDEAGQPYIVESYSELSSGTTY